MGRSEIVERIRARAEAVKALGATALYIYGRGQGVTSGQIVTSMYL